MAEHELKVFVPAEEGGENTGKRISGLKANEFKIVKRMTEPANLQMASRKYPLPTGKRLLISVLRRHDQ